MAQNYEYKFIRLEKGPDAREYESLVHEHAREGWRLVQVFAPGAGGLWAAADFCEVILERESRP